MIDPYQVEIGGVKADPYVIIKAYGITHPAIQQAVKKLLRSGRKHKSEVQDVEDAITSLQRYLEMEAGKTTLRPELSLRSNAKPRSSNGDE